MTFILAIDQGTTGSTAAIVNCKNMKLVACVNQEFPQIFPKPGWVEHDLNNIWDSVSGVVQRALSSSNINPKDIKAIGITNQRETTCAFDSKGHPLANAIVWQDRRTSQTCSQLKNEGLEEMFKKRTGLPLDPYFSGTKINWLLNNSEEVKKRVGTMDLKFGTIDTFLLYKLTNGQSYKTEPTNASRTLLMDLESTQWDQELLATLGVKAENLPEICDSIGNFGRTKGLSFLPDGIPITGILGDQQSALFGQACFKKGEMKCTYGTGAFMLVNSGTDIIHSSNGLLTTVALKAFGKTQYALEGSAFIAGAAVQFLRDQFKFFHDSSEIEKLARSVANYDQLEHLFFFPFFTGIGSPHWRPEAKGAIIGLTRDTGIAEISHVCLEGIALSINDLISSMEIDLGEKVKELKVDGGAVKNELLMELQATFSSLKIIRPQIIETTALGAALAAAIGIDETTIDDVVNSWQEDKTYLARSEIKNYCSSKKSLWTSTIQRLYLT